MAVDTVAKRMSATLSFPHALGVYPDGAVDRYAASWVYTGPVSPGPVVTAIPEIFAAVSEILKTIVKNSAIWKTLDWNSYL